MEWWVTTSNRYTGSSHHQEAVWTFEKAYPSVIPGECCCGTAFWSCSLYWFRLLGVAAECKWRPQGIASESELINSAKSILRYLKQKLDLKLTFRKSTGTRIKLIGYSDPDFASSCYSNDERSSVNRFIIMSSDTLIHRGSKRQSITATSSC